MAKAIVIWTNVADRQLKEILHYWKVRNGSISYPEKILKLTNVRINIILKYPVSYKTTIYAETRISAMGHFSILYKFQNETLIITAFWDNWQDPDKLDKIIRN